MIYITAPQIEMAREIAHHLVAENLVACANIFPQVESIYEWEGRVEDSSECVLLLKTSDKKVQEVVKKVEERHGYEVPCILVLPIEGGSQAFIHWVEKV